MEEIEARLLSLTPAEKAEVAIPTSQSPEQQTNEHLSPIAAQMILAALPGRIQRAFLAHASETQYPIELVLEMALAGFLDSESLTFADCKPEYD